MPADKLSVSASTPGVVFEDLLIMGSTRAGDAARIARTHPRVRREHRQAALDLPHHSAAGRVRLRHLAEGRLQAVRRRQRVGRRDGRREARDGVRRHRVGVVRLLRRRPGTATTCSPTACSRSTRAPASASGTSRASSTTCGTTTSPPSPNLVTVTRNGRTVDAVAQITKYGYVYVLDRRTGEPLFPIESRKVPPSAIDGERLSERQPYPVKPPPFTRQGLTEDMLTTRTPEAHAAVLARFRKYSTGFFTPPSFEGTIIFPGVDGGAEWGGAAFDPDSALLYVNSNEMPWIVQADPEQRHLALQQQVRDLPPRGSQGLAVGAVARRHRRPAHARRDRDAHPPGHRPHAGVSRHGRAQHQRRRRVPGHRRRQGHGSEADERSRAG